MMILLYLFKHLFNMEVPSKSFLEYLRNKEYQGKDSATQIIKAVKSTLNINNVARKRIIFLFNSFVSISGGDTRFIEVSKRLKDFDKVIITPFIGRKTCEMKKLNAAYILTTKETHLRNIFITYFRRIANALFLKMEIRDEDILYSTSDFLPDVLPCFVYKLKNKNAKWVQIIHHLIPLKRKGSLASNLLSYYAQRISFFFIKRHSDFIIVVNPFIKERLKEAGFHDSKIVISSNGIDTRYLKNIKPSKGIIYDGIFLGRLHPSKGIFDLVKIWKIVCKNKKNAKLGIIGSGDVRVRDELERKVKESGLENNIDILGYIDDAFTIVKSSKVFVFPSYEEGWGIAICEAMACGLPTITYDLPSYEIFGNTMVKVSVGDIETFAEAVIRLLLDGRLRRKLGEKGKRKVKQFDWSRVAQKESLFLREIATS